MKIVIFETEPWEEDVLRGACKEREFLFVEARLTAENAAEHADAEVVSTFIHSNLSREVLSRLDALKFIATRSTGFDHIDLAYCRDRGIAVSNVPEYGDNTVAEHVFALLLALYRNIPEAVSRTRTGDFNMLGLRGHDLKGKTIGVIGAGSIGRRVIEIARGFRMRILAFDPKPDEELARQLGFEYADFDRVLSESDVVTLHVPGGPATNGLLSKEAFASMKDGVVIINTSRGSVIETQALLEALSNGKVARAGLDVLDEEPTITEEAELIRSVFRKEHDLGNLLADHVLMHMKNVIVTPHIAFDTDEAVRRIAETTAANIESYCNGKPVNLVTARRRA